MGTWGFGIYENDSTRDYVDGIINNLSNMIRDSIKWDYTLLHPGMTQSNLLMCHIDLLIAICGRDELYSSLPQTVEIKQWKAKYMEVWHFCIDECQPTDDYKAGRADVLEKSFNTLIALAEQRDEADKKQSNE